MPQILENDSTHSPINFPLIDALSTSPVGTSSSEVDHFIDADDHDDQTDMTNSKGEVDKLIRAFSDNAKSLRPCLGYLISQVSLRQDGAFRIIEVPCGCWECKKCGPKLKVKWYERLKGAIMHAPHLESLIIDRAKWKSYRVALRRTGMLEYIKMAQDGDKLLILAPGEIGGTVIPAGQRKSFLFKALDGVPFIRQPISTSRGGWVGSDYRRNNEDWKTLDTVRPEKLEECEEVLSKFSDRGVTTAYSGEQSNMVAVRSLEFFIPHEMMKDGTWYTILWALGIHSRKSGESRRKRREERIAEMMAASA